LLSGKILHHETTGRCDKEVEPRLPRIRDNPFIFFALTGDSSSIALREVTPVRRCQSPGEIDDDEEEEGTEFLPSAGGEKDDLRK